MEALRTEPEPEPKPGVPVSSIHEIRSCFNGSLKAQSYKLGLKGAIAELERQNLRQNRSCVRDVSGGEGGTSTKIVSF